MNCITLRRLNDRNIRVVPQAWQDRYLEKLWRCKAEMRREAKAKAQHNECIVLRRQAW